MQRAFRFCKIKRTHLKKVVVIGGGIVGLCSAYYLVKEGHQVMVIDKGDITGGASFINAGFVVPSHFTSLAAPGMISQGLKWMFSKSSPFYVRPRIDMEFFRWACDFKRSATLENVERSIPILKNINLKSRGLYEEMLSSLDFKFHYENKGLLMVYRTPQAEEEELVLAQRAEKEGLEVLRLSQEELKALQPGYSEAVLGAVYYKCDSHTTPNHFMLALKDWLVRNGVTFELDEEINEIKTSKGKIEAVESKSKEFLGHEFVLATGSWTSPIAKKLGLNIPIQPGKGYSMNMQRPTGITIPTILTEAKVAVTPMEGFVRFAGTMEFSGNNTIIRKNSVLSIDKSIQKYYKDVKLSEEEINSAVSGLRPVSPDGLPFVGKSSIFSNLTVASGHSMMGWSLGPATGKLVSQVIGEHTPFVDLAPFSIERFHRF